MQKYLIKSAILKYTLRAISTASVKVSSVNISQQWLCTVQCLASECSYYYVCMPFVRLTHLAVRKSLSSVYWQPVEFLQENITMVKITDPKHTQAITTLNFLPDFWVLWTSLYDNDRMLKILWGVQSSLAFNIYLLRVPFLSSMLPEFLNPSSSLPKVGFSILWCQVTWYKKMAVVSSLSSGYTRANS